MAMRGCVGAAQGGARPCPRRDPLACPAIAIGVLSEGRISMGVEKKHSRADMRGSAAAAASEGGERAGVVGPQVGPCALGGGRDGAGWAG